MSTSQPATFLTLEEEGLSHETKQFLSTLPKEQRWGFAAIYKYQGFWYPPKMLLGTLACQQHFQAHHSDLLLATLPKSGTTWLKALSYAIVNRTRYHYPQHPLLTNSPQVLVPQLERDLFGETQLPNLENLSTPRLFGTHIPYSSLPNSIKETNCKVVYLCRNPRDVIVSSWHFLRKLTPKDQAPISLEERFDLFCSGISGYGPFWEHILGYWKTSLERPDKIMFLRYEDLKKETMVHLLDLANFLGYPFTVEEEKDGVREDILRLCSFENLSNLEVNKTGKTKSGIVFDAYFRKGEVGDWSNYLTTQMIERLDQLMEQKFQGSGLTFQWSSTTRA